MREAGSRCELLDSTSRTGSKSRRGVKEYAARPASIQSASRMRIGIIGAGIWGNNHALALTTHPRCTVAMICDRDEERARTTAERFGCAWTTSTEELAGAVDAVTIATPDHLHRETTAAMLRTGQHVMVERHVT